MVNDTIPVGSGASAAGTFLRRTLMSRYAPLLILALATLLAFPGLHPSQAWILPTVCIIGGLAVFEVRRRLGALLRAYARAHGAVIARAHQAGILETDAIVGSSIA